MKTDLEYDARWMAKLAGVATMTSDDIGIARGRFPA